MTSIGKSINTPDGSIGVSVIIGDYKQPLWRDLRTNHVYVAGEPGASYTLEVTNLLSGRVEVLNSIDGRNTLADEPGDIRLNTGLVFGSRCTGEFTGWRVDDHSTKAFVFADPSVSIANQATGDTSNVGVIGFAVYRERRPAPVYRGSYGGGFEALRGAGLESFGGVLRGGGLESLSADLGTGAGETIHDHVGRTTFERTSGNPSTLAIFYASEASLRAQGIITPTMPNPFPGITPAGYGSYTSVRG